MSIEVKVPVLPESVSDAIIAKWHKQPGDSVRRDENLVDLETDKVVLEVPSPVDGVLTAIIAATGDTVISQQLIAQITEGAAAPAPAPAAAPVLATPAAVPAVVAAPAPAPVAAKAPVAGSTEMSPSVRRLVAENQIDPASVPGSGRGGRITKEDVLGVLKGGPLTARTEQRVPMTRLRARIADRMMQSKNSTAMLTSFNEVNMKAVMDLRKKYAEAFEKAHGVRLGFMSFFVKACTEALKMHPIVNASVDGNDIVYHAYQDIGVAVATDKGLVVPVLRSTDAMSLADVEGSIAGFAKQAREGGLALDDLQGGTFTITNGGVFGSLFSTPIINPPQSAIFGMHAIKERAIVENGQVIAAPMMYIALSYDHRIIDGKDAVLFLVAVKNFLEDPMRLMLHL
jgi:2-oxoglutarate dehydrogenase E2 component (dihydrolipoamide succinyltransferase)